METWPLSEIENASFRLSKNAASDLDQTLAVGAVIEFLGERKNKRVLRLHSISDLGGVCFFQDQLSSGVSLCLTTERLRQHLQERSARVVKS